MSRRFWLAVCDIDCSWRIGRRSRQDWRRNWPMSVTGQQSRRQRYLLLHVTFQPLNSSEKYIIIYVHINVKCLLFFSFYLSVPGRPVYLLCFVCSTFHVPLYVLYLPHVVCCRWTAYKHTSRSWSWQRVRLRCTITGSCQTRRRPSPSCRETSASWRRDSPTTSDR